MLIKSEKSLVELYVWANAIDTKNKIIECGKEEEFEELIDELYPDGIDEIKLNYLLWFDSDWIYEQLGIENV